jgi:glycosyltransferase involved in cell wall biosynthesis
LLPFAHDPGPVYRALDIVVFPNQGRGLGRPVLEAAAYGKPVIASGSSDGADILVDGHTGILLPAAEPQALAAAVHALVLDPARRAQLGSAAADHAAKAFSPAVAAARIEALYDMIRRGHG